jgi:glycosyltransferase involved in cell wall biosynthesis
VRTRPYARDSRRFAPGLDDEALADLYRRALVTVVPSPHEGFGLPALEAMACGCPVLAARGGALPEVCGDAAVLLEPDDPRAWAHALERVAAEPALRAFLRGAGLARAAARSWAVTAAALWEIYREAARR